MSTPAGPVDPAAPADPGLPAERTSLAWRRTAISVAVGSLVALKVLPPSLGALGYALAVLGLLWCLDLTLTARRRYDEGRRHLRGDGVPPPHAPSIARTAVIATLVGVAAIACVIVMAVAR
ncbi:hypothetical protein N865_10725 [Intrasporangium oryzae NRRL B-24470]|uniref:DUF202 domain-containing protein n=1 Tax=Intrasporangium oryzae NRRL B-24470 TaxID=1386089 RepID=W9GBP1_9MICO|nr:DUF202 domain-containing protein [Intrasporangium oryzae]EWT01284.1 hypothetical protein N865_10725 [Intrasporangium oryzae NRRL B-24470]